MAEWLIEEGIGEHRAVLLEGGEVRAAKIDWPGRLAAGAVREARLVHYNPARRRGTARFAGGEEALVDRLPPNAAEGAQVRLEVVRPALAERGRYKRAQARPVDAALRPAPSLAETLGGKIVHPLPPGSWEDAWADAWRGEVEFSGGSILLSPTPAMTLVDIDGAGPSAQLALSAVPAVAAAIRRMDLAGSIGIDFPTLPGKAERQAVDRALGEALADWPHERTAMNGFGFVQLVARVERPSMLHRLGFERAAAAARLLLRRGERVTAPGPLVLTCHPAVRASLRDDWLAELGRRSGREVRIEADPALALDGGFAQAVAP